MSFAVNFELDSVEVLDLVSNNELIKVRMLIAESGVNRHNMVITPEAIEKSAFTFVGKPILAKYDVITKDAMGHEKTESPVGVCALTKDDIEIVIDDTSTKLYSIGYMWKRYCANITDLFERDGGRPISMEILVTESEKDEDGRTQINLFCGTGTTVLGLSRNPAIPNAYAEMVEFEHMVIDMANVLGFAIPKDEWGTGDKISLSLNKNDAFEGDWGDVDKTVLMNKILKAKNYTTLVNACYLVKESGWQESPSVHLKYPICVIKDDKLVYAIQGCKAALSFLEKNTGAEYYGSAKAKLKKIYSKLGLDKENFENNKKEKEGEKMFDKTEFAQTFSMTANEMRDIISAACYACKYQSGDDTHTKYWLYDYNESYCFARDDESGKMVAIPYAFIDGGCALDLENLKGARQAWIVEEDASDDVMAEFIAKINSDAEAKLEEAKSDKTEMESKIADFEAKIASFESQLAELDRLKDFETKTIEQEKNAAIEFALNDVSDDLKPEQLSEWREKAGQYPNANDFSNALKAFAFECSKGKNKHSAPPRIAIPIDNDNKNSKTSVWNRLG